MKNVEKNKQVKLIKLKGVKGFFLKIHSKHKNRDERGCLNEKRYVLKVKNKDGTKFMMNTNFIFCRSNNMTIKVFIDRDSLNDYNFSLETYRVDEI